MAARAISIGDDAGAERSWGERIALPAGGILVAVALVAAMAVALAGLPDVSRVAGASEVGSGTGTGSALVTIGDRLDPLEAVAFEHRPTSDTPVAGLAFVRCTNLWVSNADGSSAIRVLSMAGLSSPAFAPDGRTIAAFASTQEGTQLWLIAADGSRRSLAGTLRAGGAPVAGTAAGLTWSSDGGELAFALSSADSATWTTWRLDVGTGRFQAAGESGPAPSYVMRSLLAPAPRGGGDLQVLAGRGRGRWLAERLSGPLDDRAVGVAPGWWKDEWRSDTATIVTDRAGRTLVTFRRGPMRARTTSFEPPAGFAIDPSTRPAVVEAGPVVLTLIDTAGDRDLGLLDPRTGRWATLDHAWSPAVSPAPPAGTLGSARAVSLVRHLLWRVSQRREGVGLVLANGPTRPLATFDRPGFAFGAPRRDDGGWIVPATLFGTAGHSFGARTVTFLVRPEAGRLTVHVAETGRLRRIRTAEDAHRLLRSIVNVPMLPLPELPAGTTLARDAIGAWSWGGVTSGQINLRLPGGAHRYLTFHFGDGGFGCVQPVPETLATGTAAVATDPELRGVVLNQVAWPVTRPRATTAPFGISAGLPREELLAMAAEMDRARTRG